jgi:hypothetical protein
MLVREPYSQNPQLMRQPDMRHDHLAPVNFQLYYWSSSLELMALASGIRKVQLLLALELAYLHRSASARE